MTAIHETAYPRMKSSLSQEELVMLFTPTLEEISFATQYTKQFVQKMGLLIQLKVFQRLGRFLPFQQIPTSIVDYIAGHAGGEINPASHYHYRTVKQRYVKRIRTFLGITKFNKQGSICMQQAAALAAQTKNNLGDIINVMLEELIRQRFELPAFSTLLRAARAARNTINEGYYEAIYSKLKSEMILTLDNLLHHPDKGDKSTWNAIKREPKKLTPNNVKNFVTHLDWLKSLSQGMPCLMAISPAKVKQFSMEAKSLDISMMNALKPQKRYTLAVVLIHTQVAKALDDMAETFIRLMQKLHYRAEEALKDYRLMQGHQVDCLIMQFRDVVTAYSREGSKEQRFDAMSAILGNQTEQLLAECETQLAYVDNNYLPFLLPLYKFKRSLLLDCLSELKLRSSSHDRNVEYAIHFLLFHRSYHRTHFELPLSKSNYTFDFSWIPDKWLKLVTGKNKRDPLLAVKTVHRKYFEICLLTQVMLDLRSGNLYVQEREQFNDYRRQLISWEEYEKQVSYYEVQAGIQTNPARFVNELREKIEMSALMLDKAFPDNTYIRIENNSLIIKKAIAKEPPHPLKIIDKLITERMPKTNVLDMLIDTEKWLNLSCDFQPLSGFQPKISHYQERFITTLFCYGFNFGPMQTARAIKGLSRKQVAWLNLRHVTEERLDKAIIKVINAYNQFLLPKYWGTGDHVAADGTKWDIYEQNLLSQFHVRYGGYGGIGYYHVSDLYIALFSRFIPCGVYEGIHILDPLTDNQTDIKPTKVHGDTHAQSTPIFGLSYLLAISLMPRIRNIKDLIFYRPHKKTRYEHIDTLFSEAIRWDIIESHLPDMLRIVLSIQAGKISASTILRRLGHDNRKNKVYFAFRELGRAVRTEFLLRYLSDVQLRKTIHAATCKNEEFNGFLKWSFFGGEGIIAENNRYEQSKIIKYNHLVANLLILHNVEAMTRVINTLTAEGYDVNEAIIREIVPYRTQHINRFGSYTLNLAKPVQPLQFDMPIYIKAVNKDE